MTEKFYRLGLWIAGITVLLSILAWLVWTQPMPVLAQPSNLEPLYDITQIAVGGNHACALTTNGGVKCWGANYSGQLGDGTTNSENTLVDVSGLSSGVAAITAGYNHACALMTSGSVRCWGANYSGQLGDGTTNSENTPVEVSGLSSGVVAIGGGSAYTCALLVSGGVKCWGDNSDNQLNDGTYVNKLSPVAILGLANGVSAIATGGSHVCALLSSGGVKCWGYNYSGQLGEGTTDVKSTIVDVFGLSNGVRAIAAGGAHTCALLNSGVKCWGLNESGQLGDGTTVNKSIPVSVSGLNNGVSTITTGSSHTCVLTTSGGIKCWGNNLAGKLGDGTTANKSTPVDVISLNSGEIAIAAGDNHTCALTDKSSVKCWGYNNYNQLGDGVKANKNQPTTVVGLNSGITAIAAGGIIDMYIMSAHTCALTISGGVKCWGSNGYGQLGDGTTTNKNTPINVTGLNSGVVTIAAGGFHTCALTSIGGVKCWGSNYSGELGDGTTTSKNTPVNVTGLNSGVVTIATGDSHTCALTSIGGVKCWGRNYSGELGDGTTTNATIPVDVSGLNSGIVAITAGSDHTCALTAGGLVKCWGANTLGQLGDGTTGDKSTPVDVSGLNSGVIAIAAGGENDMGNTFAHTCALTVSGGVKCWGNNYSGQVGDGTTNSKTTPIDVDGLSSGIASIATGSAHTCALTTSDGVKCWGSNYSGELGNGTTDSGYRPVNVDGLSSGVASIATGAGYTCALTASNEVKCWGDNHYGQLGDGTAWRTIPVDVMEAVYADLTVTDIVIQEVGTATCGSVAYSLPQVAKVTVYNGGRAAAGAFVVSLNNTSQTVTSGLAAGATTVIEFTGGFQNGDNSAMVDANAQVQESDESNNSLLKNIWFPAATPIPTCTPTATATPTTTPTATPTDTPTATPTSIPPNPVAKKKWTMLLYLAGDTGRIDGGAVFGELRKAVRRLGSNPNPEVNVVALLDGPNDLDTYRETFTPQLHDTPLGEKPMDDPQTLVDFVQQAKQDFPAEHYYLVIADHANGVQGIAWDTTTAPNKTALLTPAKLEQALKQISNDGADPLDIVHFDGCSFGLFENVTMMHNYVNYLVLSENIGWSVFGYDQYRASLTAATTPRQFALAVAQGYAQTVAGKALPYTISAIDTNQTGAAMTALNGLADALHNYIGNDAAKRTTIDAVRSQSQKFDSARPLLEITNDDWYVDLVDFATKLKAQALDAQINTTAGVVIETLQTGATPLVIYEAHLTASIDQNSTENCVGDHVWQLDNAHGLSIYYPPRGGGGEFTRYINGDTFTYFNDQSRWDEFLQGGIPPLLPGDSPPDDVMIPLSPCSATEQQSTIQHQIYLPVIKR